MDARQIVEHFAEIIDASARKCEHHLGAMAEITQVNDRLRKAGWDMHSALTRALDELAALRWGEGTEDGILFTLEAHQALRRWEDVT